MKSYENTVTYSTSDGEGRSWKFNDTCDIDVYPSPTDEVTIEKASSSSWYYDDTQITYTITVIIGDVKEFATQVIQDVLPDGMAFMEGSLKINGESATGDITNLSVSFAPNSTNTIEYKCIIH